MHILSAVSYQQMMTSEKRYIRTTEKYYPAEFLLFAKTNILEDLPLMPTIVSSMKSMQDEQTTTSWQHSPHRHHLRISLCKTSNLWEFFVSRRFR